MRCVSLVGLVLLTLAGCSAEQMGTSTVLASSATWQLALDPGSRGLIDSRCAIGGDCGVHPNPFGCDTMDVVVSAAGQLCGRCMASGSMQPEVCGGLAVGLPYDCDVRLEGAQACVICEDLYGEVRHRDCSTSASPVSGGTAPPNRAGCIDLHDKWSGQPCQVCLNDAGAIVSNGCSTGVAGGDIGPVTPPSNSGADGTPGGGDTPGDGSDRVVTDDDPSDSGNDGPGSDGDLPDAGDGSTPDAVDHCLPSYELGAQAFVNEINRILSEGRLSPPIVREISTPPPGRLSTEAGGATRWCTTTYVHDYIDSPDGHDWGSHDLTNLWTKDFGTRVRCQVATWVATERATRPVCQRGDQCMEAFLAGAQAQSTLTMRTFVGRYDCASSPLVLDLDENGIQSELSGASFDLSGSGDALPTAWITEGDALLARDVDGDGAISSVLELFGDITANGPTSDGYAPLRALDANDDGVIDENDPAFAELLLWADDGDARSEPEELVRLAETDIVRLNVQPFYAPSEDGAGSVLSLWSSFEREDGSVGSMCDVFFADGVP